MLTRLERGLGNRPPAVTVVFAACLCAVVLTLDYLTDAELAFSLFYMIPIALLVWFVGVGFATVAAVAGAGLSLYLDLHSDATFSHAIVPYWNALASIGLYVAAIALLRALKRALIEEKELARTDVLTGIANRRRFFEIAAVEMTRSARYRRPFTLVYVDVDDFKALNDRFGHARGDDVLRCFAGAIQHTARRSDVVARLGGDEFGVLLPESPPLGVHAFLVRLKVHLNRQISELDLSVSASMGAVTFLDAPESIDAIVAAADALMYEVKRAGKDGMLQRVIGGTVSLDAPATVVPATPAL